ncbi:MAG: hypothetical protein NW216_12005 [Hyphomicrobium sp.]|nr:hypothetical protein [Hyphomicrobium sp.]
MARASESISNAFYYVLGRNTLIGIASLMLLLLSGYATWHGMRDFIVGVSQTTAEPQGVMTLSNDALVIGIVVALTFLMWLALREVFGAKRKLTDRLVMLVMYVFLAVWSIGFGYGFWWSLISGEEATRSGLSGLQEDARDASGAVAARLDAVRSQLDAVVTWSDGQMSREETSGGSCGTASGAGRGPLYNARRNVRDGVATLRDRMTRSWLEPVQADVEQLRQSASSLDAGTVEQRQKAFEQMASDIRGRARNIAARSNELGKSTAAEMRALAETVSVPPGKAGFTCYDPTLAQRLTQAAEQSDQPAEIKLREAVFNEGPAGVANAVKNLWRNIGAYMGGLATYMAGGGSGGFTDTGEPITGRDLIALLATIGVDLGLLALAILNPPPAATLRPSGEVVHQIREAIETVIRRTDADTDFEWVRTHFLHHRRASYLVIPNLYSIDSSNEREAKRALAMNQLAGVLNDLDLVRWPNKGLKVIGRRSELEELKHEETLASDTDLTDIRKGWLKKIGKENEAQMNEKDREFMSADPLRNHGLFSKAERALTIAGWSAAARRDIEIFPIVDVEGLTPLLMVLNEPSVAEAQRNSQAAGAPSRDGPVDGGPLNAPKQLPKT